MENKKITITWEDFIERIFKKLGSIEIELGWKDFDNKYLIKSDNPIFVQKIFTREVQSMMLKYNIYSISYAKNEERSSKMISVIQRNIGDICEIKEQIEMFEKIVDKMYELKIIK